MNEDGECLQDVSVLPEGRTPERTGLLLCLTLLSLPQFCGRQNVTLCFKPLFSGEPLTAGAAALARLEAEAKKRLKTKSYVLPGAILPQGNP